jgi:hypothetical protein
MRTMKRLADGASRTGGSSRGGSLQRMSMAVIQLVASATLVASILIVGIAVSIGIAGAQSVGTSVEPDAGLVLALLAIAVAVMGILSAAAVRFTGRPRSR